MDIHIRPFTAEWIPAMKAFNDRLRAGGLAEDLSFPETPELEFPNDEAAPIYQQAFLAVQDQFVRGAYYFTCEKYLVNGEELAVAHYRHPISEVVVDKAFKGVGGLLLGDAHTRQPLLYMCGMGSESNPALRRLLSSGWSHGSIDFFFRINNAGRFLEHIQPLRKKPVLRLTADAARFTGLGSVALKSLQKLRSRPIPSGVQTQIVPQFGDWADEIWNESKNSYQLISVRDCRTLNARFGARRNFVRMLVTSGGKPRGWAVLLETPMKDNKYFGDLKVGTIVDCLAAPGFEHVTIATAARELDRMGVDLVVTNQSFETWCAAVRNAGFWKGPSNYLFAVSGMLSKKLGSPVAEILDKIHFTRGDGAGISRL